MGKNQYLTSYQRGIVNRYYQHQDARVVSKLQELLSDLYMESPGPGSDKKWALIEKELAKTNAEAAKVSRVIASRDLKALGELLAAPGLSAAKLKPQCPTNDRDDV